MQCCFSQRTTTTTLELILANVQKILINSMDSREDASLEADESRDLTCVDLDTILGT